jgi:hypothetical protein
VDIADAQVVSESLRNLANRIDDLAAIGPSALPFYSVDDFASIQAAEDAANAAGGGMLQFGARTYSVLATITKRSNVHWVGAGVGATVLQLANGVNVDLVKGLSFDTLSGSGQAAGISNWSIRSMTLDGNKSGQTSGVGAGLKVYGFSYILMDVVVRNCRGDGIHSEWSTQSDAPAGSDGMEAHWVNVISHDNGGDGVYMAGPHDSEWVNGTVFQNNGAGVHVVQDGTRSGGAFQCVNVHAWGRNHTYAWDCEAPTFCANCTGEGAANAQVRFGCGSNSAPANDSVWIGGQVFAAGGAPIGFMIGKGSVAPAAIRIDTKIINCTSGDIDFAPASVGGHVIRFNAYQTTGPAVAGTAHVTDLIEANIIGSPGTILKMPTSITVPPYEGIRTDDPSVQIRFGPGGKPAFGVQGGSDVANWLVANGSNSSKKAVELFPEGADDGVWTIIYSKGNSSRVVIKSGFGLHSTAEFEGPANAVNGLWVVASPTGAPVQLRTLGDDANVDLELLPQGTGKLILGTSVALGGGAAATLGTIGGSGPAAAAQKKWLPIKTQNDGVVWVPVWQ